MSLINQEDFDKQFREVATKKVLGLGDLPKEEANAKVLQLLDALNGAGEMTLRLIERSEEIESLYGQLTECQRERDGWESSHTRLVKEFEQQLEATKLDAERYRFLRDNPDFQIEYTGELTLDEHIDKAMGKEPTC